MRKGVLDGTGPVGDTNDTGKTASAHPFSSVPLSLLARARYRIPLLFEPRKIRCMLLRIPRADYSCLGAREERKSQPRSLVEDDAVLL